MTKLVPPRRSAPIEAPANQLSVPVGSRVLDVLELAYRARRPALLEGPTGIGKSQIVAQFAKASGLDVVILDLSLLEPPDLVGLPVIEGGRTRYASPAELPVSGRGVLMLEELNRAEIPVMQPALQLLSARRLHAYELPPGWTCVAAINPEDGDYQVNRLDPALRSRFLQLSVCADRDAWLGWATRANVHPSITRLVREHADAFEHVSPRSWAYASDLLHALRPSELADRDLVQVTLRGYLPTSWALLVTDAVAAHAERSPDLDPTTLLAPGGDALLARAVRELEASRRVDAIAMLAARLRHALSGAELATCVEAGLTLSALEQLVAPLPGDLREQCLESAVESPAAPALFAQLGHDPAQVAASYCGSRLQGEVQSWRREMRLHRARLVVVAVAHWLSHADPSGVGVELSALARDAGPVGDDLARLLRARGLWVDA